MLKLFSHIFTALIISSCCHCCLWSEFSFILVLTLYQSLLPPFHHLSINLYFKSPQANPCGGSHVHRYWTEYPLLLLSNDPDSYTSPSLGTLRALTPLSSPMSASTFKWICSFSRSPRSFSPSHHSRGHLIHDADDANVAGAHVKIKSPSLSHIGRVITAYYGNGWQ